MKTQMNHLSVTHRPMNLFYAFVLSAFVALAIVVFVNVYQKANYYPTTSIPSRAINANVSFGMEQTQLPEVVVYGGELITPSNNLQETSCQIDFSSIVMPAASQYLLPGQIYFNTDYIPDFILSTISLPAVSQYLQPGQTYYDSKIAEDSIDKAFI